MGKAVLVRFQYSLKTLLLATAAAALLLTPLAWVARQRAELVEAERNALLAREVALRSVVLEERRRGEARQLRAVRASENVSGTDEQPGPTLEQLQRENLALKQEVARLRSTIEAIENTTSPTGTSSR